MKKGKAEILDEDFKEMLISGQSLSSILLDYEICTNCQHVHQIVVTGKHFCPFCKNVISIGRLFSPSSVHSLINLMQDHYQMELISISPTGERVAKKKEPRHSVGILLLFCTFIECWVESVLRSLMISSELPEEVIDRLLDDNQRLDKRKDLLKMLTGEAFGQTLTDLTKINEGNIDYNEVWTFVQHMIKRRNNVIHKGAIWIPPNVAELCINNIHGVNQLFISLHNRYVPNSTINQRR